MLSEQRLPVVILISGSGTNLQAIINGMQNGSLPIDIRAVISNRPGVDGLQRAADAGIKTAVVDHTQYDSRDSFDAQMQKTIDAYKPKLVILAGFMRILSEGFVNHYLGRMLNIHPALLPDFPGLHTHERAIESAVQEHGASVHFVTTEVDGGPIIIQARVPVLGTDTADILAARVLEQEHRIFPEAIRLYAEGKITMQDNKVLLNGTALPKSGIDFQDN
jgi:phosphoribosylglycinamide formyltransferase-1